MKPHSDIRIPSDLMESDLTMATIKRILEVREVAAKSEKAKLPPSEKVIARANSRIAWAQFAEQAIKDGEEVPPMPNGK